MTGRRTVTRVPRPHSLSTGDRAVKPRDDTVAHGQTHAGSLAWAARGPERLEDARQVLQRAGGAEHAPSGGLRRDRPTRWGRSGRIDCDGVGRLDGRVAIITGAGSGNGLAIATAFAREGAAVAIGELSEQRGAAAAGSIQSAGGETLFVA